MKISMNVTDGGWFGTPAWPDDKEILKIQKACLLVYRELGASKEGTIADAIEVIKVSFFGLEFKNNGVHSIASFKIVLSDPTQPSGFRDKFELEDRCHNLVLGNLTARGLADRLKVAIATGISNRVANLRYHAERLERL